MKCIVVALGLKGDGGEEEGAWELMPVGDRPWMQHLIEHWVEAGIREFLVVLYHRGPDIEALLRDGQRWGVRIDYRLAQSADHPLAALRGLQLETPLLVGSSLSLPELSSFSPESGHRYGDWQMVDGSEWARALQIPWSEWLGDTPPQGHVRLQGYESLLTCNRSWLEKSWTRTPEGREVEPGIWIGRDVVLHPTVRLQAPVAVGAHCRVGASASLGPGAVLGPGCLVEERCQVLESVVCPGTFLGPGLQVEGMVASPGELRLSGESQPIAIPDPSLLGSTRVSGGRFRGWFLRALARVLGWLLAPLAWWSARSQAPRTVAYVPWGSDASLERHLPGSDEPCVRIRQHFWRCFLPALSWAARGEIGLVGLHPRSAAELERLAPHARRRYLSHGPGLVSESLLQFGAGAQEAEVELAEAYQAAHPGLAYSLQLLYRYLLDVAMDTPRPAT